MTLCFETTEKMGNKATMLQSIQVVPTQPVFRLCHNVYIRIKRLQHYCLMALNQIKHLKGSTIKVM